MYLKAHIWNQWLMGLNNMLIKVMYRMLLITTLQVFQLELLI